MYVNNVIVSYAKELSLSSKSREGTNYNALKDRDAVTRPVYEECKTAIGR